MNSTVSVTVFAAMQMRWSLAVIASIMFMTITVVQAQTVATGEIAARATTTEAPKERLVLYNWADYMSQDVLDDFERQTGIRVEQTHYETDELKDEFLLATEGKGIDLVITSGISLYSYIPLGWLTPLDYSVIPNQHRIDQQWLDFYKEAITHALPLYWGTLGIAYRKDKVDGSVTSWSDLFNPRPELHKRILMIDDSRDTMGMALKYLGYSINSENSGELKAAHELLLKQKPFVRDYSYLQLGADSEIITGPIWMAMAYSGDVQLLRQHDPNISYVLPLEGTNLWVDYIAVMAASAQKAAAHKFINFLFDPRNAAKLTEATSTATTVSEAKQHLDEVYLNNSAIFPDLEVLKRSEIFHPLSPKGVRLRNQYFSEVSN